MKILHFIYDDMGNPWVGGGGAIRANETYKRLACRHQITLVCGKYPGSMDHDEGNMSTRYEGTKSNSYRLSTFCYAFSASKFMRRNYRGYDVILEDFAPWNPLFSFKLRQNTNVILQIQNYLGKEILKRYNLAGLPFYLMEKYYPLKFKNTIIVNNSLAKRYGLSRFYSLSNGIADDLLQTDFSVCDNYIGYMGRLDIYQKGLDILGEAVRGLPVKLKFAGGGGDRRKLLEVVGGPQKAELIGVVKGREKSEFLRKAKFFVLPSRYEGQGIVVLEAAACGKPVIVSDIPELQYAVEAGFGLSFRKGDSRDLAGKIKTLLEDEAMRTEMGRRAREYAKNYTWDRIALEFEAYLQSVVEAGRR